MRILFLLILVVISGSLNGQDILNKLTGSQNEDGSFGQKNQEIVTSVIINSYLYAGYTHQSKEYGETVKKALKFLCGRADELLKVPVDERHLYTLWALSEAYCLTGVSILEQKSVPLGNYILKSLKQGEEFDFSSVLTADRLIPFILAFHSYYTSGFEEVHVKPVMRALAIQIQSDQRYDPKVNFSIDVLKKLWDLKSLPKPEKIELDNKKLAIILAGLNSENSQVRKKTFQKCYYLKMGEIKFLIRELENSAITELNQVAGDFKEKIGCLQQVDLDQMSLENLSVSWLYLASCYSNSYDREKNEAFKDAVAKQFPIYKNNSREMKNPKLSDNLTDAENELVNFAFHIIIFANDDFNCLQSAFRNKKANNLIDVDGLDLID